MRRLLLPLLSFIIITACNSKKKSSDDQKVSDNQSNMTSSDHTVDVTAIMKADSAWDRASEAKSVDGWLGYYADDAIMMPPGENVCKDKASREASIKAMFAIPGMSLRFQDSKVDISNSGDLGYAVGVYQWASKDPKGNDYHETGKYCETWRKQSDGSWKCIVDIWNADAQTSK